MSDAMRDALRALVEVADWTPVADDSARAKLMMAIFEAREALAQQPAQGEAVAPADVQRVIDRLMSADPDFDDCEEAADMLRRFAIAPPAPSVPDGYALIAVEMLRAWGKLAEVEAACVYPVRRA